MSADLATERERLLTTEKRAERTKRDFRYPICRSTIGQASCLISAPSSTDVLSVAKTKAWFPSVWKRRFQSIWRQLISPWPETDSWHFAKPPLASLPNDVWETSAEIPYWYRRHFPIWIVLLIGWSKFSANQKHYPDLGSDTSSVWNFWARSSHVISQENRW